MRRVRRNVRTSSLIQDYLQVETPPTTGNLLNAFVALQDISGSGQPATVLFAADHDRADEQGQGQQRHAG